MLNWLLQNKEWVFSGVGVAIVAGILGLLLRKSKRTDASVTKGGDVSVKGGVRAGDANEGPGGDARLEGGTGTGGASGGNVNLGPGTYSAGAGGRGGKGGDLVIKGGDAKK
jgi:hypothetical protein